LQRRQSENHFDAIISGVEMMTGKTFPGDLRDRAMTGATEIDLVRSGLEDTMRQAYGDISAEWNGNPSIPDLRTAAMKIAVQRVSSSYSSLGI
jgi:glutamate dehydrogenase (NAD(P)+)